MKFALLGVDDEAVSLVRRLADSQQGQLACVSASAEGWDRVEPFFPHLQRNEPWESLLVAGDLDAVIVASATDQPRVDDSLHKLAQAAVPLVVMHPLHDAMVAYELEMMSEESGGVLLPFFPGRAHPAIAQLAELVKLADRSPLGPIEEIVMQRNLSDRSRNCVMRWLARDVNLISSLIGRITDVSSIGTQRDDSSFSNLSIHFSGGRRIKARWSLAPAREDVAGQVVLNGARGMATLRIPDGGRPWALEVQGDTPRKEVFDRWDETAALLEALADAKAGRLGSPTWQEICQDLEVCETAERSLRRKRTIEVRQDDRSEESAFKGMMAAGGCTLLMLALALLLVFAVVEGFRMPFAENPPAAATRDSVERLPLWIRLWPVYPLLAFLFLQFLLIIAKRPRKAAQSESNRSD